MTMKLRGAGLPWWQHPWKCPLCDFEKDWETATERFYIIKNHLMAWHMTQDDVQREGPRALAFVLGVVVMLVGLYYVWVLQ